MVAERVFIDTNVLVYANQELAVLHSQARTRLAALADAGAELWISRQVLRDYLAVVTRPHSRGAPLPASLAVERVRRFATVFQVAEDGSPVLDRLLDLLAAYPTGGRQVYDANIVATMLGHDLRRLITFNVSDFQRFSSLIDLEPA
jgi:predicted nucleic acid-binding protein